jgi:hypothetical protein
MSASHLIGAIAFALLATACSKQGEGERCDPNSGSLDCESGLICRSADQLSITQTRGVALCCPPDGVPPSVSACSAGAELPDDPGPAPGPGTPDAAAPAAPTDGGL